MGSQPRVDRSARSHEPASSWRDRVIVGSELGSATTPEWLMGSYDTFRQHLMNPRYPCFFGTQAEQHGEMFYSYVSGRNLLWLPQTLSTFVELGATKEFERNNMAVFFEPDPEPLPHDLYRRSFWRTLQYLHDHDPLLDAATERSPSDRLWEFSFSRSEMFVVCACPSFDARASRNLGPGMVILFQPRSVFIDKITNRAISNKARQEVRRRLGEWDTLAAHPDLGVYGEPENREWKQYFLSDDNTPTSGACPYRTTAGQRVPTSIEPRDAQVLARRA